MERDFMGVVAVKQESFDEAPVRSSAMQWSFSDKSYSVPQKNTVAEALKVVGYPFTQTKSVPATMYSNCPVVGTTDSRNGTGISTALAQLTIFYNGSVCVYDNISSEKAQAIMLLAGNAPPMTSAAKPFATPAQATTAMSSVLNGFVVGQPYGTTHFPSAFPVTSIGVSQSGSTKNNTSAVKPAGILVSSSNQAEPVKAVNPLGSVSTTFLSSESVPQSRRKSLARFLEKRKERVLSTLPYPTIESSDCGTAGAAGSKSLSVNSSSSCPVPVVN